MGHLRTHAPQQNSSPFDDLVCAGERHGQRSQLGRQTGLRETLGNQPKVFLPLERLPGEMFAKGVFWIDLFEFTPNATGFVDLIKMTESRSKHGPGKICPRHEENSLP